MNNLGAMGGPAGAQQMMNAGTPNNVPPSNVDSRQKLNTYIYDYFLKNEMFDLARMLYKHGDIEHTEKPSPNNRKDVNGAHDIEDSKDDIPNRPADLPRANVPGEAGSSFLLDWWLQFWDCWTTARSRNNSPTKQYLQHVQSRMIGDRARMNPSSQGGMNRNMMMQNGVMGDMKKALMMQGNRPQNPAQLQQLRLQQQQMAQQNQMQREGSQMDMNGQQRPQTPGSGDNAPSPKRQRLEGGGFNGQMGPMGRGQNPGMPGQQFNAMQMQNPNPNAKAMQQVYANSMRQQMQNAIDSDGQKGMQNPNGFPQGSPAMDGNSEVFNTNNIRNLQQGGGPNNSSNHALQDYQMQLMLLEQQNKKRLLMARQEQDSVANGPGGPMPGQPGFGAPAMSPSNSRTGPSPNPDEQMKRGTPKMAPGGMPQPGMDGMPQGRGSPAPGFDPNQMNPNMPPGFQNMKMGAMMGPNGQMMAATSHPAFNAQMNGQMNPQQLEMMRQQAAGRPNGPWPQGPPGMMHPGQPQQPPNMTPQQRNSNMPPPPAPATGDSQNRTQPSSPQTSNAAPPTPSQTNKPNPKSKKDSGKGSNKKAPANKKGGTTAATPASEAGDQPPTPTPAPPITPTAPAQQFNKNQPQPGANGPQAGGQPGVVNNQPPQPDMNAGPFGGSLDGGDIDFNMNFGAIDGGDVLDNFDFDSFLNNDNGDNAFPFDTNMNFGADGGLEAGTDV